MKNRRRIAGLHAAESALRNAPERIVNVWVDERRDDQRVAELLTQLAGFGISWQPASRNRLDVMAEGQNHQGIVMEVTLSQELGEDELKDALLKCQAPALYLALDQVQDPHNLGACLRTADAAGVMGLIVPRDQSASITPTVAKVASGAAETVPMYRVTNLVRALTLCKEQGLWVAGAAGESACSLHETDLSMPLVLVVGAEGKGLRRLTREHCDFLIKIPMLGQVESLNLSVATGILLYEAVRQRSSSGRSPLPGTG